MRKTIALATCSRLPRLTDDDRLLIDALARFGIDARPLVWDEGDASEFDAVIIRSCWDYHLRPQEFLRWVRAVEERGLALWNPRRIIEWNLEKTYLRDLAGRGIAIPPTVFIAAGEEVDLPAILAAREWRKAVVKPTISATAHNTWVTRPATAPADQAKLARMLAGSGVVVQRFVEEIRTRGEWSFIFFDGRFNHAVLKRAMSGDFRVQSDFGGYLDPAVASESLIEQAQRVLREVDCDLLYARVDGVEIDGELQLMELELIEPALFLDCDAHAPERFAAAALSRLGR